ncbi:hypothetical protein [Porphyrobacter sp. GA68]|uniref:hypothetical protein n=1 Tax=Porphyrobacter sp. GA68 TaxID=2883480 RepID=UPI001D18A67E|nr:hypothetical protein [Porphyrobacter sp. GA68]
MKTASALVVTGLALLSLSAPPAQASQTTTYTYDARGRLVKVERTGNPNSNARTEYRHDRAHNRTRVTTTGAPR